MEVNFRQSVIIAELWWPKLQDLKILWATSAVFFIKLTPYGKIFKILFQTFTRWHWLIDVVVFKCRKICPMGNRRNHALCVIYLTKRNLDCLSTCRYCVDRAQNLPRPDPTFGSHCSKLHINRFAFGRVIAKRVNTILLPHGVFPWFARSKASLRANNNSVKNEMTSFGTHNPEEIWHKWLWTFPSYLKNVNTLPCKMQNSFTRLKLHFA